MKYRFKATIPAETRGWGENKRTLPALVGTIELDIDLDRIMSHFGAKAIRSRGKRAAGLSGMVKARAKDIKEQP